MLNSSHPQFIVRPNARNTGDEEMLHRCRPLIERGEAPNSPRFCPTRVRAEVRRPRERPRRFFFRSNLSGSPPALALSHNSWGSLGRVLRRVAEIGVRVRATVSGRVGWAPGLEPLPTKSEIEHALPTDRGACMQEERNGLRSFVPEEKHVSSRHKTSSLCLHGKSQHCRRAAF